MTENEIGKTLKEPFARACLAIAIGLFVLGFFVMCACPGWYALASIFAGLSVWLRSGHRRRLSWFWLFFCLVMMTAQFFAMKQEQKVMAERIRRFEAAQRQKALQTNSSVIQTNVH
jgi:hypothetical protein